MGDVLSFVGIAVLLVLLVASVRQVRMEKERNQLEVDARAGSDAAQRERSRQNREDIRAARAAAGSGER